AAASLRGSRGVSGTTTTARDEDAVGQRGPADADVRRAAAASTGAGASSAVASAIAPAHRSGVVTIVGSATFSTNYEEDLLVRCDSERRRCAPAFATVGRRAEPSAAAAIDVECRRCDG